MLHAIGVESADELFAAIPVEFRKPEAESSAAVI